MMSREKQLNEILQLYLEDFNQKSRYGFVVRPSIPIVWFGNLEKYNSSIGKIVTVALNPSHKEFPANRSRFDLSARTPQALRATLNNYFLDYPYTQWFRAFESVLKCFNATYYESDDRFPRSAIHIDIYSAIATQPTWGKLTPAQRNQLSRTDLFSRLLALLDPDMIVFSGNINIFREVFTNAHLEFEYRAQNFSGSYIRKYSYGDKLIVTGLNYRGQPFGGMPHDETAQVLNQINQDFAAFLMAKSKRKLFLGE